MNENTFSWDDLENALTELNEVDAPQIKMTDEMIASQKRYEEYLKKDAK